MPTIGVDITTKIVKVDNVEVKLILHDTAGQEVFGRLRRRYYEGSIACIVVYDITRRDSFDSLKDWVEDYQSVQGKDKSMVLIANKIDLEDSRQVTFEEGQAFAESLGLPFYECSAKIGGENIPKVYEDIVKVNLSSLT